MTSIEQLLTEYQNRAHLSTYQLDLLKEYAEWIYGMGYDHGRTRDLGIEVAQIKDGMIIRTFPTIEHAAKALQVNESSIRKAVRGEIKTCKGYNWRVVKKVA